MKRPFDKPGTSHSQQIELLRQRGMVVSDPAEAEHCLRHVHYYRLGAYWLPFEASHATHRFREGTRFGDVWNLYVFDRELRLLVMDAIERVEVSVRSSWAYEMGHRHGPHSHLAPELAARRDRWEENLASLRDEVDRSHETFIEHLRAKYAEELPPVWAVCEVMSLGQLSRWYGNLRPMPTRRAIADCFGFDERVLAQLLHHLTHVRNVCAHHGRLWNREFTITPTLPRTKPAGVQKQLVPGSRRLYNTLALLAYALEVVAPGSTWRGRLVALIARHGVAAAEMGFPEGWRQFDLWDEVS